MRRYVNVATELAYKLNERHKNGGETGEFGGILSGLLSSSSTSSAQKKRSALPQEEEENEEGDPKEEEEEEKEVDERIKLAREAMKAAKTSKSTQNQRARRFESRD